MYNLLFTSTKSLFPSSLSYVMYYSVVLLHYTSLKCTSEVCILCYSNTQTIHWCSSHWGIHPWKAINHLYTEPIINEQCITNTTGGIKWYIYEHYSNISPFSLWIHCSNITFSWIQCSNINNSPSGNNVAIEWEDYLLIHIAYIADVCGLTLVHSPWFVDYKSSTIMYIMYNIPTLIHKLTKLRCIVNLQRVIHFQECSDVFVALLWTYFYWNIKHLLKYTHSSLGQLLVTSKLQYF